MVARKKRCWSNLGLVNKEAGTWPARDMITIIKSAGSGKDDVGVLSKTREALREKVFLEMKRVATK